MANFDKIKINGTSYLVHDTATATALSAETQAREQAIANLQSQIEGLPDDFSKIIAAAEQAQAQVQEILDLSRLEISYESGTETITFTTSDHEPTA